MQRQVHPSLLPTFTQLDRCLMFLGRLCVRADGFAQTGCVRGLPCGQ